MENLSNSNAELNVENYPHSSEPNMENLSNSNAEFNVEINPHSSEPNMENFINSYAEFNGENYPHSSDVKRILRDRFNLMQFQNIQLPVINAALLGHNCLVEIPTGGYKSLCYQLPALLSNGTTVVVAPLKAIIYNQLEKLEALNIGAAHFSGDQTQDEQRQLQSNFQNLDVKILYVTPDKANWSEIVVPFLKELLEKKLISRFIIDEAHCVSKSHYFRPSYELVCDVKELFRTVQTMAFTATATPCVRLDIVKQLEFENVKYFVADLNRPNLKYSILPGKSYKMENILNFIRNQPRNDSGIVFCHTRLDCQSLAMYLKSKDICADYYHSKITDDMKKKIQHDWRTNEIQVVCATYAFGSGIDKPDVRFVLHYSMPQSMEHYFQETGRAGHDGILAQCVLFYDVANYNFYCRFDDVHRQDLFHIDNYCNNRLDCRRSQLLNYFGKDFDRNDCLRNPETACDNCINPHQYMEINVLQIVRYILMFIISASSQYTVLDICGELVRKNILPTWSPVDQERLIKYMIKKDYLRENITFDSSDVAQAYIDLGPEHNNIMNENIDLIFKIHTYYQSM